MNNPENYSEYRGGPAFPTQSKDGYWMPGMTLLDYFAAQALSGIIAAHSADGVVLPECERAARWAYQYADAMIARRIAQEAPTDTKPTG